MKILHSVFLFLCFYNYFSFAQQEKKPENIFKHHFLVGLGSHYNYKIGQKYFPPEPRNFDNNFYGGYSLIFTLGYQAELLYKISFNRFYCKIGLQYFTRDRKISCNKDSILKYAPPAKLNESVVINKNRFNNIEVPITIGVEFKRFALESGLSIVLLSKCSGYSILYNNYKYKAHFPIHWFKGPQMICPHLRLSYLINKRSLPLYVYASIDYQKVNKFFDFGIGVNITVL